jgi:large subunit ribosomal protein L7Ae
MKKFFSYVIVIALTYAVSAYVNNKEFREKVQMYVQQKILRTQKVEIMYVKPKFIYVRKEASEQSVLLGLLRKGTQVEVLKTEDKWSFIKTPSGVTGWVKYEVLTSTPVVKKQVEVVSKAKQKEEYVQEQQVEQQLQQEKISQQPLEVIEATQILPPLDEPPEVIKEELKKQQEKKEEPKKVVKEEKPKQQPTQETITQKEQKQQTTTQQETQQTQEKPKKEKKVKPPKTETTQEEPQQEEYITCPNCGAEVIKGERFCPYCREPLPK